MSKVKYGPERISKAIYLAERLAKREQALLDARAPGIPAFLRKEKQELVGESMDAVASDPLAERLLVQARNVMKMRSLRHEFVDEKTFVGRLAHQIDDLYESLGFMEQDFDDLEAAIETGKDYEGIPMEDFDQCVKEAWKLFVDGITSDNQRKTLYALQLLIHSVERDLITAERDLPPVAPPYQIPRRRRREK